MANFDKDFYDVHKNVFNSPIHQKMLSLGRSTFDNEAIIQINRRMELLQPVLQSRYYPEILTAAQKVNELAAPMRKPIAKLKYAFNNTGASAVLVSINKALPAGSIFSMCTTATQFLDLCSENEVIVDFLENTDFVGLIGAEPPQSIEESSEVIVSAGSQLTAEMAVISKRRRPTVKEAIDFIVAVVTLLTFLQSCDQNTVNMRIAAAQERQAIAQERIADAVENFFTTASEAGETPVSLVNAFESSSYRPKYSANFTQEAAEGLAIFFCVKITN